MKKLSLFLFLSTSLFCFGQGKSALKDIQSIKFYGVDYSQVKIFGADESPAQFKDAFRRINELFIGNPEGYLKHVLLFLVCDMNDFTIWPKLLICFKI